MVSESERELVLSYVRHQSAKPPHELAAIVREGNTAFLRLVESLDDETARRAPADGEWSIRQLVLHVITTQESMAQTIANISRGRFPPLPRGGGPGFVPPDDGRPYASLVRHLGQASSAMCAAIDGVPAQPDTSMRVEHPWFGPFDWSGWAVLQRVHDQDHVKHASEILATILSR
jgi:hypothetical protein